MNVTSLDRFTSISPATISPLALSGTSSLSSPTHDIMHPQDSVDIDFSNSSSSYTDPVEAAKKGAIEGAAVGMVAGAVVGGAAAPESAGLTIPVGIMCGATAGYHVGRFIGAATAHVGNAAESLWNKAFGGENQPSDNSRYIY